MGTIREHKNFVAVGFVLIGAIANFMTIPSWAGWLTFALFVAAWVYLLYDAARIRATVISAARRRSTDTDSGEKLVDQAVAFYNNVDH